MRESTCDREIEAQPERFEDCSDGGSPAYNGKKRNQGNAPPFDIRMYLFQMTGVDLTWIDGIDGYTALKMVSEVGTDMTKWENAKRLASWLGLSPNNRITGGKVISSRTKASANRAAPLRQRPGHVPEVEEGPNCIPLPTKSATASNPCQGRKH